MISLILSIAERVGANGYLLLAICTAESNLKNVNNYEDRIEPSYGICQLQVTTARTINPHIGTLALQRPRVNIEIAAKLIKKLERKYNSTEEIIAAYNAGGTRYKKDGTFINQNYVDKVIQIYYNYIDRLILSEGEELYDQSKI